MSILFAVSVLLSPASARASLIHTVDQAQTEASSGSGFDGQTRLAQTFTAGITGYLDQVDLYLARQPSAVDAVAVQIQTVSGFGPSGTVLASASVQPADVPSGGDWVSIPIGPIPVEAGTQYAIVVALPEASSDFYAWFGAAGDVYVGGDTWVDSPPPGGGWTPIADDRAFQTYVFVPSVLDFTSIDNFSISRDGEKMALVGEFGGVHGLYRADRDGSNVVALETRAQPDHHYPRDSDFSPDGQTIVFESEAPTCTEGGALFLISSQGGPSTYLTGPALSPRFSPDGSTIVTAAYVPQDPCGPDISCSYPTSPPCLLNTVDAQTGVQSRLFDNYPGSAKTPSYTNDGANVLFSMDEQIASIPATGGAPTPLTNLASGASHPESSYAPANAGQIVFLSGNGDAIYTMNADGSGLTEAISGVSFLRNVHWTPAGRIAYLTNDYQGIVRLEVPLDPTSESVGAGGSASSLPDGPTEFAPVASTVTTPNAGTVTIDTTDPSDPPPSGYRFLGQQVEISAPAATAADPLVLVFELDSSLLAEAGVTASTVELFRNGLRLLGCGAPAPGASPDPCVGSRETLPDGDGRLTVRTSQASNWNFGKPGGSTAVRLASLSASRSGMDVRVRWRTATETNTIGFNVYRQQKNKLTRLNRTLIPSVFVGTTSGHAYTWLDRTAPRGKATYRLQAVSLSGKRSWVGSAVVSS